MKGTTQSPRSVIPRDQVGTAPQRLLAVLFGDYWLGRAEPLPSGALVDLLSIFGVSETGARAAIQRLAQRGFLVAHRQGRKTAYAVQKEIRETVAMHVERLFESHHSTAWDGTWTLVTYLLPGQESSDRRQLRDELRGLKFGNLADGVWIRPGNSVNAVISALNQLSDEVGNDIGIFHQSKLVWPSSTQHVRSAFDADSIDEEYQQFIDIWTPKAEALERNSVMGEEALRLRTEVMSEWRMLVHKDPNLPAELLSNPAPLHRAATVCASIYDALGTPAEHVVRQILQAHDPDLAEHVSHHTFESSRAAIVATSSSHTLE